MINLYQIFAFLYGAIIGSYLNVLIHRLPREKDTVFERSKCPQCHTKIKWYQNIPLMSFIVLRGKCSYCQHKISWRYPLVELITAVAASVFFSYYVLGSSHLDLGFIHFLFFFAIFCAFLVHIFIDLEHHLLLDKINLFLLAIFFPYVVLFRPIFFWLSGAVIGFGLTFLVTYLFYKIRGQIGLGGGDIKLFGLLGLYLGPIGIVQNIFLSCLLGSIVGLGLIIFKKMDKSRPIAFGPYIIIVASFQIFAPDVFELTMAQLGFLTL